ncbi:MAG: hypothetical protein IH840_14940 [Candidatus Heimdallarchaeota archaeon]|nr:hypothetical protein [Candidatus Heimdallarchaeota archaeon]
MYQYYKITGSKLYLPLIVLFIRYAIWNAVIIRVIYYENFTIDYGEQDPHYWVGYKYVGFIVLLAQVGMLMLFLHVFRMKKFSEQHVTYKIFSSYLLIELVTHIVAFTIHYVETLFTSNWSFSGTLGYWNPYKWYMKLFPSYLYIPDISPLANPWYVILPGLLTYVFVAYTYLTIKPETDTKGLLYSRIAWFIFVTSAFIFDFANILVGTEVVGFSDVLIIFNWGAVAEFISVAGIIVLLYFFPETLLITQEQIFRATNLYKILEEKSMVQVGLPFINRTEQFMDYIQQLPPELLREGPSKASE